VRRRIAVPLLVLFLAAGGGTPADEPATAAEQTGQEQARAAAARFGQALEQGDAALLKDLLPARGKVQLRLDLLGPGDGFFSPNQVLALLSGFLDQGSVNSFDLVRVEFDENRYALAYGRAELVDRTGRPARVDLQLAFQPEDGRWVLREMRETKS
jgi:hypothetical protein